MRYLAIGDIHGYAGVLRELLAAVQVRPDDQIITLGDYVDRGPDSRGVIDEMLALQKRGQLIALRGNHDSMMLEARKGPDYLREWLFCGGRSTLASYGDPEADGLLEKVPAEHWKFLEEDCVDWYEIDTHFFVHANANADLPLEEQPLYLLHWEALYDARPHCSGKVMVCGHTKQRSGQPRNWGHAVCIDTWVYGDGWLTCLDVKSGRLWQANRHGDLRTGWLEEPEELPDEDC
jgi:serine/threonine protein phosphatase 1